MKSYRDIAGDGGSNILGQVAEQTQRLQARMAGVRHSLAVMSGKGGVGKSAVSVNLAAALAVSGCRVGILDADLNGPTVARMLGISGTRPILKPDGVLPVVGPAGLKVMSMDLFLPSEEAPVEWDGPPTETYVWRQTMEATAVREFLTDTLWGELDLLIIDLPPGSDRLPNLYSLLPRLSGSVVVTLPSEISQFVVHKSITAARKLGSPLLGLIENMAGYLCPGCETLRPLFPTGKAESLAARYGICYLGSIPFDPRLCECGDRGVPLALAEPESLVAATFRDVARKLQDSLARKSS